MNRLIPGLLVLAIAAFALAALLTGDAIWAVPVLILLGIVGLMFAGQAALKKRVEQTGGDTTLPAAHVEAEDSTDLGDTAQAHDEISPHDLPVDHPGRQEAERQAG
jgi:hypothetical protein